MSSVRISGGELPGGAFFGTYSFANYFNLGQYPTGNITNNRRRSRELELECAQSCHSGWRGFARRSVCHAKLQHRSPLTADAGWTQQNYAQSDPLSGNSIASKFVVTTDSKHILPVYPKLGGGDGADWH